MGCLTFISARQNGDVQFHASTLCDLDIHGEQIASLKVEASTEVSAEIRGVWRRSLNVICALLCPTNLGDQYLWSSEHLLISFDGQRFIVKKGN